MNHQRTYGKQSVGQNTTRASSVEPVEGRFFLWDRANAFCPVTVTIYFPTLFIAACAAASLAIGTLNGEQET